MCEYHSQGTLIHVLYVEGRLNSIFILKEIIVSICAKCPVLLWSAFFLNICHGMLLPEECWMNTYPFFNETPARFYFILHNLNFATELQSLGYPRTRWRGSILWNSRQMTKLRWKYGLHLQSKLKKKMQLLHCKCVS